MCYSLLKNTTSICLCVLFPQTQFTRKGKKFSQPPYPRQNVDIIIMWRNISNISNYKKC